MSKKIDTAHVVKLEENNYNRWKLQITLVLKDAEVWEVVSGDSVRPPVSKPDERKAWDKLDVKAQAILVITLGKTQTDHIYSCKRAKMIFDRLKVINSDRNTLVGANSLVLIICNF